MKEKALELSILQMMKNSNAISMRITRKAVVFISRRMAQWLKDIGGVIFCNDQGII
jgi:hypothetical protein